MTDLSKKVTKNTEDISEINTQLAENTTHINENTNKIEENKNGLNTKMNKSGGTFTGIAQAYSNTSYSVRQIRNIIISEDEPNVSLMQDGDIWFVLKKE